LHIRVRRNRVPGITDKGEEAENRPGLAGTWDSGAKLSQERGKRSHFPVKNGLKSGGVDY
jgi:hypothetical protein